MKIYRVGGSVRDELMGLKPKDVDYAIEANSFDAMRQEILARGCQIFLETPQFFTIRAKDAVLGVVDFALCRKDGIYRDGRRPEDVSVGTIYDDLARRDFCANAIAVDVVSGEVLDPFGGIQDIKDKVLRAVGDVNQRFEEDKLRALRAIRFSLTKGFSLASDVDMAILSLGLDDFKGVSTDRIRDELHKMFVFDTVEAMRIISSEYVIFGKLMQERKLWLKPTSEKV